MNINRGLNENDRKKIVEGLSRLLADTYTLYLKTHNFHWNIKGPHFLTLHSLFEMQYKELADAVDVIAERIRALGYPAPGSYAQYSQLTVIKEAKDPLSAEDMVKQLCVDQEIIVQTMR